LKPIKSELNIVPKGYWPNHFAIREIVENTSNKNLFTLPISDWGAKESNRPRLRSSRAQAEKNNDVRTTVNGSR
jgi:hypothetical protein